MLKIGIFSDVHGHLAELKKTLELFEKFAVDEIVCAGDLVAKGTQTNEVLALMHEKNIPCILGNHDAKAKFIWLSFEPLTRASLDYLNALPETLRFEWKNISVRLCHANPWEDYSVYVFPTRPQALFEMVADSVEETIIILGHTHHPMCITVGTKTLINPGSIYGNRDRAECTCGILTLPDITFEIFNIETGEKLAF